MEAYNHIFIFMSQLLIYIFASSKLSLVTFSHKIKLLGAQFLEKKFIAYTTVYQLWFVCFAHKSPFCYCICNVVMLSCKVQQFPEQQNTVHCDGTDIMKGFADSIIEQIP